MGDFIARYEMGIDSVRSYDLVKGIITEPIVTGRDKVHSKMNKIPYVGLAWSSSNDMNVDTGGAVEVARGIYPVTSTEYGVVSTLIYDVQWDTTINWIARTKLADETEKYPNILTDSTNYGNYADHIITSKSELNEGARYGQLVMEEIGYVRISDIPQYVAVPEDFAKDDETEVALTTGALKAAKTNNIYDMGGNMAEMTMGGYDSGERAIRGCSFDLYGTFFLVPLHIILDSPAYMDCIITSRLALYIK